MKQRRLLAASCALAGLLAAADSPPTNPKIAPFLADLKSIMQDMEEVVNTEYAPTSKVDKAFGQRSDETRRQLGTAQSLNDAYLMISDTLWSLDPRMRLHPPQRTALVDYGWDWRVVGDEAYVCQVDQAGEARKLGLQLGDKIVTVDGLPLNRRTYQQVYYLLNTLAPRPGLLVVAQTAGAEPRRLAIPATVRKQRAQRIHFSGEGTELSRAPTAAGEQRAHDFQNVKLHVKRFGNVGVWDATELYRDASAVAQGWKLLEGADSLILDLRGRYVGKYETIVRLAQNLFRTDVEIGRIAKNGLDVTLRVKGAREAFSGTLLVLVDSETAAYAEVLAHVIQREKRGVIVGDRTMGRVFEEKHVLTGRGRPNSLTLARLALPAGEVVLADGAQLDGKGVTPDYLLQPKPADFGGRRDVVLSKALAMLKQTVTPEEAYKIFPHYADEDDEY